MLRTSSCREEQTGPAQLYSDKMFLEELKSVEYELYLFQKDSITENTSEMIRDILNYNVERTLLSYPIIIPVDLGPVKHYVYPEMKDITDAFSQSNVICHTKHGRLFKGTIISNNDDDKKLDKHQNVVVKIWDFLFPPMESCFDHPRRIHDELVLLTDSRINSHPNLLKLIGFHCDQRLAVIYQDFTPKCFLSKYLLSDEFEWEDRLNAAICIADMLLTFHQNNHVHGGIKSDCIMLDENLRPVSIDFGDISIQENPTKYYGPYHFMRNMRLRKMWNMSGQDEVVDAHIEEEPKWCKKDDIFSYGILLMELISKQKAEYCTYCQWLEVQPGSVVHSSFDKVQQDAACKITSLAYDCLQVKSEKQPSLEHVIETLKKYASVPAKKKQKY